MINSVINGHKNCYCLQIRTDFDVDTRSCVCYSMSKYSPGEEFRIFYGERGNSDLLLNQVS